MQTHLWSQSISVKSSRGHQALLLLAALLLPSLILFSCGGSGGGGGGDKTAAAPPPDPIYLWTTTTSDHTGNLGGIVEANKVCANDTAKIAALPDLPTGVTYTHQAVLADAGSHPSSIIPSSDTNQVQRPDGTKIAENYQAFAGSTANVDAGVTSNSIEYWTGLQPDSDSGTFTTPPGSHCSNWSNEETSGSGFIGLSQEAGSGRLGRRGVSFCNSTHHLLCISHTPPTE